MKGYLAKWAFSEKFSARPITIVGADIGGYSARRLARLSAEHVQEAKALLLNAPARCLRRELVMAGAACGACSANLRRQAAINVYRSWAWPIRLGERRVSTRRVYRARHQASI